MSQATSSYSNSHLQLKIKLIPQCHKATKSVHMVWICRQLPVSLLNNQRTASNDSMFADSDEIQKQASIS